MNYLQFRNKLVSKVRRTDFTATSNDIHIICNEARKEVQTRCNLSGMEASGKFTTALVEGDYRFALPPSFKEDTDLRVLDSSDKIKIIMAKEADRNKFNRLVILDNVQYILDAYKNTLIILDVVGLDGTPLIYNIWNQTLEIFPKVAGQTVGNYLWMAFYRYIDTDLSSLPPGPGTDQMDGFTDFLFQEHENLTFYAAMTGAGLHFKDEDMVDRWDSLFEQAIGRMYRNEIAKKEAGRSGGCFGD